MEQRDYAPAKLDDSAIAVLRSFETELSSKSHQDIVLIAYSVNKSNDSTRFTADSD
jgi:hypothetical protein